MPGLLKAGIDDINSLVKPHVKVLTENQLKEMQSTKVIMILWVKWKKPVKSAITIDPKTKVILRMLRVILLIMIQSSLSIADAS